MLGESGRNIDRTNECIKAGKYAAVQHHRAEIHIRSALPDISCLRRSTQVDGRIQDAARVANPAVINELGKRCMGAADFATPQPGQPGAALNQRMSSGRAS